MSRFTTAEVSVALHEDFFDNEEVRDLTMESIGNTLPKLMDTAGSVTEEIIHDKEITHIPEIGHYHPDPKEFIKVAIDVDLDQASNPEYRTKLKNKAEKSVFNLWKVKNEIRSEQNG